MKELELQDKYLINFICDRNDGLNYQEVKANTVTANFFIKADLRAFLKETKLNKGNYRKLLKQFNTEEELMTDFIQFLEDKIKSSANMALFINTYKSITYKGVKLHLFYPSGSETHEDSLFEENIFSVVQELPYTFKYEKKLHFSFRPDITFFLNGIYLGYSELKSNYNNQSARNNGLKKVGKDYLTAVEEYLKIAKQNDLNQSIRRQFLKAFEKAIHITATDVTETYIVRNIARHFEKIKTISQSGSYDFDAYHKALKKDFKKYPVLNREAERTEQFEDTFRVLYGKKMIEREILYYNFIERELIKKEGSKTKEYKHNDGRLISPRPKQKFGADKIMTKIDEFLAHESEPDYLVLKLRKELEEKGLGETQIEELIGKRLKYQNNKHVYSLLMQYAAGFGKSNIIGWTALQLKDLRSDGKYVYDKIMLVVDRLQLRDQLDSKMHNMNIQKSMFIEASDKKSFMTALQSDRRIVVVNVQKFSTVKDVLNDGVIEHLSKMRIAFLIDEIHRSNSGVQHEEMISVFDELQSSFDNNETYKNLQTKKNLIVGFTATPSDHTLARFGEFNKYAEAEKIWIPFDSYTMSEAIKDGYILNPIRGIVPVSAKMYFEAPVNELEGFEGDTGYEFETIPNGTDTGVDDEGRKYSIRKKKIYSNPDRIEAISKFVAQRLVSAVYHNIRGTAKAMLAASSIPAAIKYKGFVEKYYNQLVQEKKYERFKDAPIYIVYSENQEYRKSSALNGGVSEKQVLQNFKLAKNGLIIVVDKLQTGFDEPKLHTLFLDKEIRGINAIQTISRVNRKAKHKNDCKIVDFSYKNINVQNIQKAFAHFSNVVVSDFNPLGDEEKLGVNYHELINNPLYINNINAYKTYLSGDQYGNRDINIILNLENVFTSYIRSNQEEVKLLKSKINQYFKILNLIEYVIEIEKQYSEPFFLDFWRAFNKTYNIVNRPDEIIDDVEIYFDNKIGLIEPLEYEEKVNKKPSVAAEPLGGGKQYRYDILKVIEKRNLEEEAIAELIEEFEAKITSFFDFIKVDALGKRLVAKITDEGSAFSQDEIHNDFSRVYRKFILKNKDIGDFFKNETKGTLNQLCDEFEREVLG